MPDEDARISLQPLALRIARSTVTDQRELRTRNDTRTIQSDYRIGSYHVAAFTSAHETAAFTLTVA